MIVAVCAVSIQQSDITAWNTSGRAVEAVVDAHLQTTNVEIVKVAVQCRVPVLCNQMPVVVLLESKTKEVPNVTENDED